MALQETISNALVQTDNLLQQNGLYRVFTYTEVSTSEESYNEVTGEYAASAITTTVHTFNAIPLEQRGSNLKDDVFNVVMDIIAIPFNVPFKMSVDLPIEYNGDIWTVASYKVAPQDGVYEIVLGRK